VRSDFGPNSSVPAGTVNSTWEMTFSRQGDRWVITGLECLSIFGQTPQGEWINWGNRQIGRRR
jgi:hypothetical protein